MGNRHDFGAYEDIKENNDNVGVNLDVVLERVSNEGLTEKGRNTSQHARSWTLKTSFQSVTIHSEEEGTFLPTNQIEQIDHPEYSGSQPVRKMKNNRRQSKRMNSSRRTMPRNLCRVDCTLIMVMFVIGQEDLTNC